MCLCVCRSATTFHPDSCAAITEILPKLEYWKRTSKVDNTNSNDNINNEQMDAMDFIQSEIKGRLRTVLRSRILRGFPLNIAFTDVDDVMKEVKSLCIHESNHPEAQFVLGVRAFPLVNNLVSLWVFVGTLETVS